MRLLRIESRSVSIPGMSNPVARNSACAGASNADVPRQIPTITTRNSNGRNGLRYANIAAMAIPAALATAARRTVLLIKPSGADPKLMPIRMPPTNAAAVRTNLIGQ